MKDHPHTDTPAGETRGSVTAKDRWNLFEKRLQLENITKVCLAEQAKLEKIPTDDLQLILKLYTDGTHLREIHRYIVSLYGIQVDSEMLARYWRRVLPGFKEAEEQRREFRTAKRALRNLIQEDRYAT